MATFTVWPKAVTVELQGPLKKRFIQIPDRGKIESGFCVVTNCPVYSVKEFVTGLSTKCKSVTILFMWALLH